MVTIPPAPSKPIPHHVAYQGTSGKTSDAPGMLESTVEIAVSMKLPSCTLPSLVLGFVVEDRESARGQCEQDNERHAAHDAV